MNVKCRFSKKDIVVILGCVVFALANVGAIGGSGRSRAKEMICRSNLKRWGRIWHRYAKDNDGYFLSKYFGPFIFHYGQEQLIRNMLLCPRARKTFDQGGRNPYMAWGPINHYENEKSYQDVIGSYVTNNWIANNSGSTGGLEYWRTPNIIGGYNVPIMADGQWNNMDPYPSDAPPEHATDIWTPNAHEMRRVCIDRHNGGVNCVFMDGSVRKVGLKSLWRLHWARNWPDDYPLPVWPEWMANFKEP